MVLLFLDKNWRSNQVIITDHLSRVAFELVLTYLQFNGFNPLKNTLWVHNVKCLHRLLLMGLSGRDCFHNLSRCIGSCSTLATDFLSSSIQVVDSGSDDVTFETGWGLDHELVCKSENSVILSHTTIFA